MTISKFENKNQIRVTKELSERLGVKQPLIFASYRITKVDQIVPFSASILKKVIKAEADFQKANRKLDKLEVNYLEFPVKGVSLNDLYSEHANATAIEQVRDVVDPLFQEKLIDASAQRDETFANRQSILDNLGLELHHAKGASHSHDGIHGADENYAHRFNEVLAHFSS